jgi:alpha/beta superfamily hydrolase
VSTLNIKQSVINTFNRIGLEYQDLLNDTSKVEVYNRFGFGSCVTTPLIARCIDKIYSISNAYERGDMSVNISDFDRLRYFVMEQDQEAYMTCID